jgi:hypothetical protein
MFDTNDFIVPKASEIQSGNMQLVNNNDQQVFNMQEEPNEVEIPDIDIESELQLHNVMENPEQIDDSNIDSQSNNLEIQNNNLDIVKPQLNPVLNNQNTKTIKKYYIQQLFWICNPRLEKDKDLPENQAHFVSIDFNLSFNNLKISLYEFTENSFDNHVLFINNNKLLISGTIYPINCLRALKSKEYNFTCVEQLITQTNEPWEKQRPMVVLEKTNNVINMYMYTFDQKKMWYYEFADWQKDALERAFEYCITSGFHVCGQKVLI